MTVINAFHPDYVKTYHPDLLKSLAVEAKQQADGVINGGKSKKNREAKKGKTVNTINVGKQQSIQRELEKAYTRAALDRKKKEMLARKDFFTFQKAGMPKGVTL